MGYQTVIMVLNDAMDKVKENKEQFADTVYNAYRIRGNSQTFSLGNHCNPIKIFDAKHADEPQLVMAYQNDFVRFGYGSDLTDERHLEYRKRMLEVAKCELEYEEKLILKMEEKIHKIAEV